jgi:alpha-galactosidase
MLEHVAEFRVRAMCRALSVKASGYYAWRGRQPSERTTENERLVAKIKALHAKSRGLYGSPKIYRQLRRDGEVVNHKRVEKLMKAHAIRAKESSGFA